MEIKNIILGNKYIIPKDKLFRMKSKKIKRKIEINDPMSSGFYSAAEAGRLLHIKFPRILSHWLTKHPTDMAPLIIRQYEVIDGQQTLGFFDLMEARSINHFRDKGVSIQALRTAAFNLRKELNVDHPFSTNTKLMTDCRDIFLHSAKETGDDVLLNLVTKQFKIFQAWEQFLEEGIDFNMDTRLPISWTPIPKEFPNVIVDPQFAYGHPTISIKHVPTSALFNLWKAEKNFEAVGNWFGVNPALAKQAVKFEQRLVA